MEPSEACPCVILNEPQLAENIGAVARVMANFGLSDLRLVRPRDGWPQERAWASASGADWPLDNARVFDRLEDAVGRPAAALGHHRPAARGAPAAADAARGGRRAAGRGGQGWPRPSVWRRAGGAGDRGHRPLPGDHHRADRSEVPLAEPGPGGGDQRL